MPRMKLTKEEFDPKALDVEYEPSQFKRYTGEVPRTGTILIHRITKMWWGQSSDGTSMITALAVAEQNNGKLKEYNGLTTWAYMPFKPEAAFMYKPFLENFGISLMDIRNRMMVAVNDDGIGTPIESIAGIEPGSDDMLCRIVIQRDFYNEEYRSKVDREGWLPFEDEEPEDIDDEEPEEEDEPEERSTRARGRTTQAPARGDKAGSGRRRAEPEPEDEDDEYDEEDEDADEDAEEDEYQEEEEEEQRPVRSSRRTSSSASSRAGSRATSRSGGSRTTTRDNTSRSTRTNTRRAQGRAQGSTDDPPF